MKEKNPAIADEEIIEKVNELKPKYSVSQIQERFRELNEMTHIYLD